MKLLDRRRLLQRLGAGLGASFLLPTARGLLREALGAAPARKRFIVFVYSNGLHATRYRSQPRSETDFDLREIFKPLEPYKRDLLVMEPLFNPASVNLHGNYANALTVMGKSYSAFGGVSLDRYIAQKIGAGDPFSSTNLAHWYRNGAPHVSADGPDKPFPAEWNPLRAHQTMFAGGGSGAPGKDAAALLAEDRSVLDALTADIGRLNGRLGGPERAKLDQYLASVRALETQMTGLVKAQGGCGDPSAPTVAAAANDFKIGNEVLDEVIRAFVHVTFNAQACGLTRVSSISFSARGEPHHLYRFLGDTIGHHKQCHDRNDPMIAKIDTYVVSQMAEMWRRLKTVPEGSGTMADNSLLLLVNTGGGVHHGGAGNHCLVTLGSAGGALRTGRYLSFANDKRCVSDVFCSLATAMGVPTSKFGDPAACKGPVPGLLV